MSFSDLVKMFTVIVMESDSERQTYLSEVSLLTDDLSKALLYAVRSNDQMAIGDEDSAAVNERNFLKFARKAYNRAELLDKSEDL